MRVLCSDEDIEVFAEKSAEITSGVFIHTNVKNFSLSKYKGFMVIWGKLLIQLKAEGWRHLYAVPPGPAEEKWERMFGFKDSGLQVSDYKLMILEL